MGAHRLFRDDEQAAREGRWPRPGRRRSEQDGPAGTLSTDARSVLALQGRVGNSAVASVMRRPAPGPGAVGAQLGRAVVQRQPKPPKWIEEAQKELRSLFPKEKLMAGVVIKDYSDLNDELQGMGYGAWTQSPTEIYLRDPKTLEGVTAKNRASMLRYILQHEANHIRQFARFKGPPKTWQQMLQHEIEAYGNDKQWLAASGKTQIKDANLRKALVKGVEENLKNAIDVLWLAADAPDSEAFLYGEMKKRNLIPQDAAKDPLELYKH